MGELGIQPLVDMSALVLQSAFLEDDIDGYRPLSLLFIAKPESGKTSIISKFFGHKFIYYTDEITVKILVNDVLEKAKEKEVRFLLLPDILNSIEKQKSTKEPLLNTLKSTIEEGVTHIKTFTKDFHYEVPVKIGLITGITSQAFEGSRWEAGAKRYFDKIGFLSRMIPFSFQYPISLLRKIFDYLNSGEAPAFVKLPILNMPKNAWKFKRNKSLLTQFEVVSNKVAQQYSGYGIRIHKGLTKLAMANAMMDKRHEITQEDIDKIMKLANWINFDFNIMDEKL